METITKNEIFEWELEVLKMLKENGGRYRSGDLIRDIEKRLNLSKHAKSLNNSEQARWVTALRFNSVGLQKAGLIKKEQGFWWLVNKNNIDIDSLTPDSLMEICDKAYAEWQNNNNESQDNIIDEEEYLDYPTNNISIEPLSISFSDILKNVDKSLIQIPPFQRSFVWSTKEICNLLDSINRGYPIGSFIFWKTTRILPHHREIGGLKLHEANLGYPFDYVLDGQQRITSLYAAIRGAEIEDDKYIFYFNINNNTFQSEKVTENNQEPESLSNKIPLDKLFVESGSEYHKYVSEYPEKYHDKLHELYDRFTKYKFSVIYIKDENEDSNEEDNETVKKIVNIFTRINETGKKLTVVAKMVARCWGEDFDIRKKLDALYEINKDFDEIREETILQAVSVILNDRRSRTNDILNTNVQNLNDEWDSIIDSLKISLEFVKNNIKIKSLKYLPFDKLLVPLTYFHYKKKNPSNQQMEQLRVWFWKACLANRYGSSVEGKLMEDCEYFDEILNGEKPEVTYQIDWETFKNRLINQDYNLRNAFCKTILSLYSYLDPKSLKDGRDIDIDESLTGYYKNNLHHFFPRKYLEKVSDPLISNRNSIVNIAFAPAIVNIEMSDNSPSDYIEKFRSENSKIDEILKTHLIDDVDEFGINENNFSKFLEKRSEKIENQFRILLNLKTKTEQQFDDEPSAPLDLLEIRLRTLLQDKLNETYADDFWKEAIPSDIKFTVKNKVQSHLNNHPYDRDKFVSASSKLGFLDIMDYSKIMLFNWDIFENIFKSKSELEKHFLALKNYRNSIKHNREMNEVEKRNGEASVLWFNEILNLL